MVRIRDFEETAADCFMKGMLAGNIHLSIGQEAVASGACTAMEKGDYMTTTHRGHGHCIAKGGDMNSWRRYSYRHRFCSGFQDLERQSCYGLLLR